MFIGSNKGHYSSITDLRFVPGAVDLSRTPDRVAAQFDAEAARLRRFHATHPPRHLQPPPQSAASISGAASASSVAAALAAATSGSSAAAQQAARALALAAAAVAPLLPARGEPYRAAAPRLLSLGADRRLVEYDVARASIKDGVLVAAASAVDQTDAAVAMLPLPGVVATAAEFRRAAASLAGANTNSSSSGGGGVMVTASGGVIHPGAGGALPPASVLSHCESGDLLVQSDCVVVSTEGYKLKLFHQQTAFPSQHIAAAAAAAAGSVPLTAGGAGSIGTAGGVGSVLATPAASRMLSGGAPGTATGVALGGGGGGDRGLDTPHHGPASTANMMNSPFRTPGGARKAASAGAHGATGAAAGAAAGNTALMRPTEQAAAFNRGGAQPFWWAPLLCSDPALVTSSGCDSSANGGASGDDAADAGFNGEPSSALRALVAEAQSSASASGGANNSGSGLSATAVCPLSAFKHLICRKVTLAPAYGGPVTRLVSLPTRVPASASASVSGAAAGAGGPQRRFAASSYVVYACDSKIIGLMKLPLTGDPERSMAMLAHPGALTALAPTCDGRFVLTAGGRDRTVNLWGVNTAALDASLALAASSTANSSSASYSATVTGDSVTDSYLQLITDGAAADGGLALGSSSASAAAARASGGAVTAAEVYEELVDAFHHSQLRADGLHKSGERRVTGRIPLAEAVVMMRTLGFYPSEAQVEEIHAEVMWDAFISPQAANNNISNSSNGSGSDAALLAAATARAARRITPVPTRGGVREETVGLRDVIRLLANHRPVFGIAPGAVEGAVGVLGAAMTQVRLFEVSSRYITKLINVFRA